MIEMVVWQVAHIKTALACLVGYDGQVLGGVKFVPPYARFSGLTLPCEWPVFPQGIGRAIYIGR